MAAALSHLASNGIEGKSIMSNTENSRVLDGGSQPEFGFSYSKYLGGSRGGETEIKMNDILLEMKNISEKLARRPCA